MKKKAGGKGPYACRECGMRYKERVWAEKCRRWCEEHKSCNLDIIKRAVRK